MFTHGTLQRGFAFHDQPGGPQQRIGHHQAHAAKQCKGRQPTKRPAAVAASAYLEAVNHRTDDNPLAEGCQNRAAHKGLIPEWTM